MFKVKFEESVPDMIHTSSAPTLTGLLFPADSHSNVSGPGPVAVHGSTSLLPSTSTTVGNAVMAGGGVVEAKITKCICISGVHQRMTFQSIMTQDII